MISAALLNWASEYLTSDMAVKMRNVKGWVADLDPIFLFWATSSYHDFLSTSVLYQLGFRSSSS